MLCGSLDLDALFRQSEAALIGELTEAAAGTGAADLLDGLFGPHRRLYKRVAQFSYFEQREVYDRLARRPYEWLVACVEQLADLASTALKRRVAPHEILLDAPPVTREVEFNIDVHFPKEGRYWPLRDVSPVVRTLALEQFDDYVKRVRLFAQPRLADELHRLADLTQLIESAINLTG
jgi:hypothetical protein